MRVTDASSACHKFVEIDSTYHELNDFAGASSLTFFKYRLSGTMEMGIVTALIHTRCAFPLSTLSCVPESSLSIHFFIN